MLLYSSPVLLLYAAFFSTDMIAPLALNLQIVCGAENTPSSLNLIDVAVLSGDASRIDTASFSFLVKLVKCDSFILIEYKATTNKQVRYN